MKTTKQALSTIAAAVAFSLMFAFSGLAVTDLVRETPTGRRWQQMEAEIQSLREQLAAESEPRTSAEAVKRVQVMTRIIALYGEGRILFAQASPVTDDSTRERQWYAHMARACRLYGDTWRRRAGEMEVTAASLRGQGR